MIFLPFVLFHSFYYVHGDYYADHYLRLNTGLIRDKLNIEEGVAKDPLNDDVPDRVHLA